MTDIHKLSRRRFLVRGASLGATALAAPTLLAACGDKELKCDDVSSLSGAERSMREQLKYVDKSPNPNKLCNNCSFYKKAAKKDTCGACTLVKGPIHPNGYCTSWAAKS